MPAIGQALASHTSSTTAQNSGIPTTGTTQRIVSAADVKIAGKPHTISTTTASQVQTTFTKALLEKQERDLQKEKNIAPSHTSNKQKFVPLTSTSNTSTDDYSGSDAIGANRRSTSKSATAPITKALLTASSLLRFGIEGLHDQGLWQQTTTTDTSDTVLTPKTIDRIIEATKREPAYKATHEDIELAQAWINQDKTGKITLENNAGLAEDNCAQTTTASEPTSSLKKILSDSHARNRRSAKTPTKASDLVTNLKTYQYRDYHIKIQDYRYWSFTGMWAMRRIHNSFKVSLDVQTTDYLHPGEGKTFTIPPNTYEDIYYNYAKDKPKFHEIKFRLSEKEIPIISADLSLWETYDDENDKTYTDSIITFPEHLLFSSANKFSFSHHSAFSYDDIAGDFVVHVVDKKQEYYMRIKKADHFYDEKCVLHLKNYQGNFVTNKKIRIIPETLAPTNAVWR